MRSAAEKVLRRFLEEIPPAELVKLGFAEGDVAGAEPGEPCPVYTITPDNLLSASPETSVENLLSPTGLWYFPVFCDGAARTILTVTRIDGEWETRSRSSGSQAASGRSGGEPAATSAEPPTRRLRGKKTAPAALVGDGPASMAPSPCPGLFFIILLFFLAG